MGTRRANKALLPYVGYWSHGIAHGYYGGSHEYRLILLEDGRGAFIHDGWWVYRYGAFQWNRCNETITLTQQRFIDGAMGTGNRCLRLDGRALLSFDKALERERMDVPLIGEPHDYYLITRDVTEANLHLEYLRELVHSNPPPSSF